MKTFKYSALALAAAAFGLASCSSEEVVEPVSNPTETVRVRANVTVDNAYTRTIIGEKDGDLTWKWHENDVLYVTDEKGIGVGTLKPIELDAVNSTSASFEGELSLRPGDYKLYIHYFGNVHTEGAAAINGNVVIDYTKAVSGLRDDLTGYDVLCSDGEIDVTVLNRYGDTEQTEDNILVIPDFRMVHKTAQALFEVEGVENIAKVTVKNVYTKADYTFSNVDGVRSWNFTNLQKEDMVFTSGKFYLPVLPQQQADFKFEVVDTEGRVWEGDFRKKADPSQVVAFDVQPGYYYRSGHEVGMKPTLTAKRVLSYVLLAADGETVLKSEDHQLKSGETSWTVNVPADLDYKLPADKMATGWKLNNTGDLINLVFNFTLTEENPTAKYYLQVKNKYTTGTGDGTIPGKNPLD